MSLLYNKEITDFSFILFADPTTKSGFLADA